MDSPKGTPKVYVHSRKKIRIKKSNSLGSISRTGHDESIPRSESTVAVSAPFNPFKRAIPPSSPRRSLRVRVENPVESTATIVAPSESAFLRSLSSSTMTVSQDSSVSGRSSGLPVPTFTSDLNDNSAQSRPLLEQLPVDFNIKSRVGLLTPRELPVCFLLDSREEARKLSGLGCSCEPSSVDSFKLSLSRACMVWMHPYSPFLPSFPSTHPKASQGNGEVLKAAVESSTLMKAVMTDWKRSLFSVYNLFRSGRLQSFYVASSRVQIMFRSLKENTGDSYAVISPTTSGLRSLLKQEGVDFSLPLVSKTSLPQAKVDDPDGPDEVFMDMEDWLQDLGLAIGTSPRKGHLVVPPKSISVDSRPQSTIVVHPDSVHTFFNVLHNSVQNSKILGTHVGPHAGAPPTILASHPFEGSTLRSLPIEAGQRKGQWTDGSSRMLYGVDIKGPVLPSILESIMVCLQQHHLSLFNVQLHDYKIGSCFNVQASEGGSGVGRESIDSLEASTRPRVPGGKSLASATRIEEGFDCTYR